MKVEVQNQEIENRERGLEEGTDRRRHFKLLKDYVKVRRMDSEIVTFGGDQNFFQTVYRGDVPESEDMKKQKMGCGIVALSDIFLYFSGKYNKDLSYHGISYVNRMMDQREYCDYYDEIYAFAGGVSLKGGVSGMKLWRTFNRMARLQGWEERARWGFSQRKRLERIREMLLKDVPVLLCIPMAFLKKDREKRLKLYQRNETGKICVSARVSGHYVVVTELTEEKGEICLVISSWGKPYVIKWNEYEALCKSMLFGRIIGNILYITRR